MNILVEDLVVAKLYLKQIIPQLVIVTQCEIGDAKLAMRKTSIFCNLCLKYAEKIRNFENQRKNQLFMQTQLKMLNFQQMAQILIKQLLRYYNFHFFIYFLNQIADLQEQK
eukprot:TRINITY_DN5348_c2_g1_i1.p4 TRINITY_DN5348_c2_g1~~TRINITY_DN5348_c2_g1_i1.p4  ORF type:complete len:111 (-),score=2.52 TRINITY_DN5348_c2_g1_i1:111-443(-)